MLGDSATVVGFGLRSCYPGSTLAEVLSALAPRLRSADLAIGNLECPITNQGVGSSRWARNQMRGEVEYAQVLRNAGFSAIGIANNHAVQHGEEGFAATVAALRAAGLLVLGLRGRAPWLAEPATVQARDGSSVAVLGYSWRPRQYGSGPPPYAEVDPPGVLGDIGRARASHDSVVVSLHWGEEFVNQPSVDEVAFARAMTEQGADLVLGHHPHVVRPVERFGGSIVAFSLGNAVSDMAWMDPLREGLLLETELDPRAGPVTLTRMYSDERYRVRLGGETGMAFPPPLAPLDTEAYSAACQAGIARQRAASYRYTLKNGYRFPPAVLATLVVQTLRNKLGLATTPGPDRTE